MKTLPLLFHGQLGPRKILLLLVTYHLPKGSHNIQCMCHASTLMPPAPEFIIQTVCRHRATSSFSPSTMKTRVRPFLILYLDFYQLNILNLHKSI